MAIIEDKVREVLGDDAPPLITRSQAADLLSVSRGTLDSMISSGSISEVGGTKKLALADVVRLMAGQNLAASDVPAGVAEHVAKAVK